MTGGGMFGEPWDSIVTGVAVLTLAVAVWFIFQLPMPVRRK